MLWLLNQLICKPQRLNLKNHSNQMVASEIIICCENATFSEMFGTNRHLGDKLAWFVTLLG